jgi:uncharacterized protein (DUF2344 family)
MADLPLAYTQGFSKKMRLNLIQPLPLGMEGLNEYLHITMTSEMATADILKAISDKQQNKLTIKKIVNVKYPSKWFSKHLFAAVYRVIASEGSDLNSFCSTFPDKIISLTELSKNEYLITTVNTPQLQINPFKLFALQPNLDIIEIQRTRLVYQT